ncbi:DEAD/DEAH box helicase [Sphingomonas sp. SUN019]|uniref:helicase-related protein n=1 Tax=Sphingomonas sp. SUN019 TaxID=2937788 RepID=UPI002164A304|nr:helicase-related protein [Sphingomonas sp. SUN019]UVO50095.1 DEAD/DEAH box helicase [Sphingomonas sp. SUN019]
MNIAFIATRIADTLKTDDIVYLADDQQVAEALSAAVQALVPGGLVYHVGSSDALPGDVAPASPANAGHRVATLRALRLVQQNKSRARIACIMSGEAAAHRYPRPEAFDTAPPVLSVGDLIDGEQLAATIDALGYFADDRVDEPGEMAIRGDVIDIFPADAALPARIDIADNHVIAIRSYDPTTQRTVDELEEVEIGRAAEPPLEDAVSILDHLLPGVLGLSDQADKRRQRFVALAKDAARSADARIDAIDDDRWAAACKDWHSIAFDAEGATVPRFAEARSPLAALARFAKPLLADGRVLMLAGNRRDIRFLRPKLAKRLALDMPDVTGWAAIETLAPGDAACIELPVDAGFVDAQRVLITAADVMGSRALIGGETSPAALPWARTGAEIRVGDVVVHEDHGVALVHGLEAAPGADGAPTEMIALEYAGGGRRLVAIDDADRIWRYGADADAVTLDKLDGSSWLKRRGAIDIAIAESAKGLAALAEARAALTAPVMVPDAAAYERFAGGFPFNESGDQTKAIAAVRDDLSSGKPMDRLIIGDVGYGKTEVALRAAALAALAGYQVVIAAPTTVLVRQHLESFRRRFAASGIAIGGLSRVSSATEKKAVKAGLADGSIQIVVGTGAVMAKGVSFAKLGLVVVDEEQRFGAADKARLRGSGETHLLTLSATPIPRTLQMALIGLQQMSIIATPPARRQPIRTSLDHFDKVRFRTALIREKGRGGQSFVVVPRIEDMAGLAQSLHDLLPELSVIQAHGKMPPAEIDDAMVGFADGNGDVLLATNIIEAGLDVPRANTMIVWRADCFGLAQLHQLRGRVGRGGRRGQVIMLTESDNAIGERTKKRLRTLATFDRLGAGFDISAQDLDMRGAGDLLGENQAGHIKLIGLDLYQHLLGSALQRARGETIERWSPELNLGSAGSLPASWIPEADVRLTLYIRLSRIEDDAGLEAFEEELLDRFGPLPPESETLLARARVRHAARTMRVERIDAGPAAIALTPRRDFDGDFAGAGLSDKNGRFLLVERTDDAGRIDRIQTLLESLVA